MKLSKTLLIFAVASLAVSAASLVFGHVRTTRFPNFEGKVSLYVHPGDTPESVISQISSQTKILRPAELRNVFSEMKTDRYLKPGHYDIDKGYSSVRVARMLNNGWQTPVRMTLAGSLRLKSDLASKISRQLMIDSTAMASALDDTELLKQFGLTPQTVMGIFIPDTYEIWWDASSRQIIGKMKNVYDAYWDGEKTARAAAVGLNPMEVMTLASIVQSESNAEQEYPQIAGVYLNRLKSHRKLQACPTVAYCYNYKLKHILNEHTRVDSPYNTYRNYGLPPGPICAPGKAAIESVLNADTESGYMYFCASPSFDGTHRFASGWSEHSKNAREYQRELSKRERSSK